MARNNQFVTRFAQVVMFLLSVLIPNKNIRAQLTLPNVFVVNKSKSTFNLKRIEIKEDCTILEFSANNTINDTTYAAYCSLSSNTHLTCGGKVYKLIEANGISIAPMITRYTKPNETLYFRLKFSALPANTDSFDFLEDTVSDWNINNIQLVNLSASNLLTFEDNRKYAAIFAKECEKLITDSQFADVESSCLPILDTLRAKGLCNNSLFVTALYEYATACKRQGKEDKAYAAAKKVLELYEDNRWSKNIPYAWMSAMLGDIHASRKEYKEALDFTLESARLKKSIYKVENEDYAMSLGKIAQYYSGLGDFSKAILYEENCLRVKQSLISKANESVLKTAYNLCIYYFAANRFAECKALSNMIASDLDPQKSEEELWWIRFQSLQINTLSSMGNEKQAAVISKKLYPMLQQHSFNEDEYNILLANIVNHFSGEDQIRVYEKILRYPKSNKLNTSIAQNLANAYFSVGKVDKAISLQEEALTVLRSKNVYDKTKECESLNHLALFYMSSNDSIKCIEILKGAEDLTKELFGEVSYEYADVLYMHYLAIRKWFKFDNAFPVTCQLFHVYESLVLRDFPYLNYSEKEGMWNSMCDKFYEDYIFCFGIFTLLFPDYADSAAKLTYNNLLFTKGLLLNADMVRRNNGHKETTDWLSTQRQADEEQDSIIERTIVLAREVRDALSEGEIAVEFVQGGSGEYIALIIDKEHIDPQTVILEKTFQSFNPTSYMHDESEIIEAIWKPIIDNRKDVSTIFFSPDAELYRLPIENVKLSNSKGKEIEIHRLMSTKELVLGNVRNCNISFENSLLLSGGDIEEDCFTAEQRNVVNTTLLSAEEELNSIENILHKKDKSRNTINNAHCSEKAFYCYLNEKPQLIHFATHSYYWKSDSLYIQKQQHAKTSTDSLRHDWSAMLRSGILLSDYQDRVQENRLKDGVLTAFDIYNLDLSSVDLVVLSSCKSGLGDISQDGVLGLQRAFKAAGVKHIVASLWNVDDNATRVLMETFYRNLQKNDSLQVALRKAQESLRSYKGGVYSAPVYWAGFVVID